ncbi:hypothetical protein M0R45_018984 [Rubus argutus]|uniref:MADS-box domain-containing protein n=1 Tax=Rubus argutus TaxID=59490 RepID=A0AAW1X4L6_RUBAR
MTSSTYSKEKQRRLSEPSKDMKQKTRQRVFQNRWSTLKRKAKLLADLCNSQVCMVMSGSNNGNVEVWPDSENAATAQAVMIKYLESNNERSVMRKNKQELNLSDFSEIKEDKVVDSGKGVKDHHKGFAVWDEAFDNLSRVSWIDLSAFLESKVQKLDETIKSIEASNPIYMDQGNGYFVEVENFGSKAENYRNNNFLIESFPLWGFSECYNNQMNQQEYKMGNYCLEGSSI